MFQAEITVDICLASLWVSGGLYFGSKFCDRLITFILGIYAQLLELANSVLACI